MIQVQADMLIRRPRSSCRQGASLEKKCEILEFLPSHLFYYPAPGAPDVAFSHPTQARNQDFMWGGANEAKVDQTTEMYFLLSDPFI